MSANPPGFFTHQEILSQPDAWMAALDVIQQEMGAVQRFYQENRFEAVMFTGCGSTYYLALAAAVLMQRQCNIEARALPVSEIWLYPRSAYLADRPTLLVAVSRSGETTETLRAVESFKARGTGAVLTISCYPGRPLPGMGDLNLLLPSGQENSVAQTRAFSVLYLTTMALTALCSGQDHLLDELAELPDIARKLIATYAPLMQELGRSASLDRFYFLGSGPRYGLASELSLKMKEMALSHAEPFHFLEFRHGPKSMITPGALVVGLLSRTHHESEGKVLDEMSAMGAQILSLGDNAQHTVAFRSGMSETACNLLYLPVGQLLAYERALYGGHDPDRPKNLDTVVRLDENT
jgi:glutamine---fructose-6-phosphate transaminase (isomerizing)